MEAAAAKLAGELAEYKAESRELRNQEHTIRRLEERARTLEAQLDEKVNPVKRSVKLQGSGEIGLCNQARGIHDPQPTLVSEQARLPRLIRKHHDMKVCSANSGKAMIFWGGSGCAGMTDPH